MNEAIQTLDKILPVVDRVHGEHHPELHEVLSLYLQWKQAPSAELLQKLSEITNCFSVPEDACPTYAKAYHLLASLS